MASKLKILVDHTCDVFCDYELIGQAIPNKLFYCELRKGKYILEFKVKDDVENRYIYTESFDYIMDSNDEEDLIRINLLKKVIIKEINLPKVHILTKKDIDCNEGEPNWHYILHINNNNSIELSLIKNSKKLEIVLTGEKTYSYFDIYEKYDINIKIEQEIEESDNNILYDYSLIDTLGLIVDTQIKTFIYKKDPNNNNNEWTISGIYPFTGYIYEYDKDIAFIRKDKKFGLYDLKKMELLVSPKYDEIFNFYYHSSDGTPFESFLCNKEGTFTVKINNHFEKIDVHGKIIVPIDYDSFYSCYLGHVVKQNNKWGIYTNGEVKEWYDDIFIYDRFSKYDTHHDIDEVEMEILFCRKGDKYGFWNCIGEISDIIYDDFNTSRLDGHLGDDFIFTKRRGKTGLINNRGIVFIDCLYDEIYFEYFYEASTYIFDIFPSFVYYTMTNKKTESYLKWEREMIEKGKLKTDYSFEEAKKLIYIPQFIVRNGDLYGVVQLDNKEILPVIYTKQEAEYYVQEKAIEWSNKFL